MSKIATNGRIGDSKKTLKNINKIIENGGCQQR
jgi:hypothetical protein